MSGNLQNFQISTIRCSGSLNNNGVIARGRMPPTWHYIEKGNILKNRIFKLEPNEKSFCFRKNKRRLKKCFFALKQYLFSAAFSVLQNRFHQ
jgi:hypothetical protein